MHSTPSSIPDNYEFSREEQSLFLKFWIDLNIPDLSEHFPGQPLVPGFMQLQWLQFALNLNPPHKLQLSFKNVKFISPIVPPGEVHLNLLKLSEEGAFSFQISFEDSLKTKGRLVKVSEKMRD